MSKLYDAAGNRMTPAHANKKGCDIATLWALP